MKKKFTNIKKKKNFLKELVGKQLLFNQIDKMGKTAIEYEENEEIKLFYAENFKVKQK